MEGKEFQPPVEQPTDDGFSEAKVAKVIEGVQTDNTQVKKRKPVVLPTSRPSRLKQVALPLRKREGLSRKEKIVIAYKKNASAIMRLVDGLVGILGTNQRQEEQIIEDIKKIRHMQEELLNALILEQKGQLVENAISKEAWDLIK